MEISAEETVEENAHSEVELHELHAEQKLGRSAMDECNLRKELDCRLRGTETS